MNGISEGIQQFRQQRAEQRPKKPLTAAQANIEKRKEKIFQDINLRANKQQLLSELKDLFAEEQAKEKRTKAAARGSVLGLSKTHLQNINK